MRHPARALLLIAFAAVPSLAAEPHLPVGDPGYLRLERLAARGLIDGSQLSTRPLGREALVRLLRDARERVSHAPPDPWVAGDLATLEARMASLGRAAAPRADMEVKGGHSSFMPSALDRRGVRPDDAMVRSGLDLGGEWAAVGWGFIPEIRYPAGPGHDLDLVFRSAYVTGVWANLSLTVGRESLWWGPGIRGVLLLTDHPPPLDLVRLETARPWWIGRGGLSFHVFTGRLESDRADVPRPFLSGIRLVYHPHPVLEVAVARNAMFGGRRRPVTGQVIWDVLRARGENTPGGPGNQLAAAEVVLRIPWRRQPITLYGEIGGEDEANGWPSHPAVIAGVYLPTVAGSARWELRGEWADNALSRVPGVWYEHGIYTAGYTYRGFILGHPMGTDSRMLTLEATYRLTPTVDLTGLYDALQHRVFEPSEDSGRSVGMRLMTDTGGGGVGGEYRYARWEQPGSRTREAHRIDLSYRASW